jgi:flavin-dependent dehydrogenase
LRAIEKSIMTTCSAALPCRGVLSAWGGSDLSFFDYELRACEPALAIDRREFDQALVRAVELAGADVRLGCRVYTVENSPDGPFRLRVQDNDSTDVWESRFVVLATGRHGMLSGDWNEAVDFRDRLIGFASHTHSPPRDADLLLLDVCDAGWWYVSRFGSGPAWAVFLTDSDMVPAAVAKRQTWLKFQYSQARMLQTQLTSVPDFAHARVIDARSRRRRKFCSPGWIAVGDAAWCNDPLSGKGIEMAIVSARRAAEAIIPYLGNQDVSQLEEYDRWCQSESTAMWREQTTVYASVNPQLHQFRFWQRRLTEVDRV